MRRSREEENNTSTSDLNDLLLQDASLLPIQVRRHTTTKSQRAPNKWMTSTFVPPSRISSGTEEENNNNNNREKVAPWSQFVDLLKPKKEEEQNQTDEESLPVLPTGLAYHEDCANHHPRRHPHANEFEIPERTTFTMRHLRECGLDKVCDPIQVVEASDDQLCRVHNFDHIQSVDGTKFFGLQAIPNVGYAGDLYASNGTARAARLAAGGVTEAALKVAKGELQNALCVVRPPGHHCSGTKPSGFCFYNNVAVAARAAQSEVEGVKKVLILDWDVHHGDGTESVFYEDPSVCVISIHQHSFGKGHVFHRPPKEEMPGVRKKVRKVKEEENEEEYLGANQQQQPDEGEVAGEDELLDLLEGLEDEDQNISNNNTSNDNVPNDAPAINPEEKQHLPAEEKPKTEQQDEVIKEQETEKEQEEKKSPSQPLQTSRRGARRAAATNAMLELLAAEKAAEEARERKEQEQQQVEQQVKQQQEKQQVEQEVKVDDDAAMAFFAGVLGQEKLEIKDKKKRKNDDEDEDDDDSSRNTSSLNSQKLFSSDDDDDEDDERRRKRMEFDDDDNNSSSSQNSDRELPDYGDEVYSEYHLSPLESHTGHKFHKTYKKNAAPFYPGTGHMHRVGSGAGVGSNINIPWPCTNFGDVEYLRVLNELVIPVANEFKPDLIIISCGLDCCAGDLLGSMKITPSGIFLMTSLLSEKVSKKVVVALEGGYMLRNVALSCEAALRALLQYSAAPSVVKTKKLINEDNGENGDQVKTETVATSSKAAVARKSTMLLDQTTRLIEDVKSYHSPYWKCMQE